MPSRVISDFRHPSPTFFHVRIVDGVQSDGKHIDGERSDGEQSDGEQSDASLAVSDSDARAFSRVLASALFRMDGAGTSGTHSLASSIVSFVFFIVSFVVISFVVIISSVRDGEMIDTTACWW